jgi:hypothetical protein
MSQPLVTTQNLIDFIYAAETIQGRNLFVEI